MIVEGYRPHSPQDENVLRKLQLRRMEAGREAGEAWSALRRKAHNLVVPRRAGSASRTVMGTILANAQTIATGVMIGMRVMRVVRTWRRR